MTSSLYWLMNFPHSAMTVLLGSLGLAMHQNNSINLLKSCCMHTVHLRGRTFKGSLDLTQPFEFARRKHCISNKGRPWQHLQSPGQLWLLSLKIADSMMISKQTFCNVLGLFSRPWWMGLLCSHWIH